MSTAYTTQNRMTGLCDAGMVLDLRTRTAFKKPRRNSLCTSSCMASSTCTPKWYLIAERVNLLSFSTNDLAKIDYRPAFYPIAPRFLFFSLFSARKYPTPSRTFGTEFAVWILAVYFCGVKLNRGVGVEFHIWWSVINARRRIFQLGYIYRWGILPFCFALTPWS